jgi:hypothetical protein
VYCPWVWISGLAARRGGGGIAKLWSGYGDVLKRVCGRVVGHEMARDLRVSRDGRILLELVRNLGSESVYRYCAYMVDGCSSLSLDKKTEFKMYQHMRVNPLLVDELAPRRQAVESERIPNRRGSGVVYLGCMVRYTFKSRHSHSIVLDFGLPMSSEVTLEHFDSQDGRAEEGVFTYII